MTTADARGDDGVWWGVGAGRYGVFRGQLVERWLDAAVSPLLVAIARRHVPEKAHEDFLRFVSTGCATEQLHMMIRYMGGTRAPVSHIEIEEFEGRVLATATLEGGVDVVRGGVMIATTARTPAALVAALPGRPLSDLVRHPLLPLDAPIVAARSGNAYVSVELAPGRAAIAAALERSEGEGE